MAFDHINSPLLTPKLVKFGLISGIYRGEKVIERKHKGNICFFQTTSSGQPTCLIANASKLARSTTTGDFRLING